jgi:hypothetical protein
MRRASDRPLAATERPLVRARAARLHRDALRCAWPGLPPPPLGLSRRVSTVVTAIAPDLSHQRLSVLLRYALWTFLLDDRFDRSDADPAALARLARSLVAATIGGPAGADPLITALSAIRERLSSYDRTGEVVARFGAALREAVTGDLEHARLARAVAAGRAEPPTAEGYLAVAARTVNYRSFAYALLAVAGAAPSGPGLDRLDPPLRHASYAIRLGNDLRSVARDRVRGALNVLDLCTARGSPVTERWVGRAIGRRLRAHDRALVADRHLAGPDRLLTRSLRLSVAVYRAGDLR